MWLRSTLLVCGFILLAICVAHAKDPTGKYNNSPYKQWFDAAKDANGQSCCWEADAHRYYGDYTINGDGSVTLEDKTVIPKEKVLLGYNPVGVPIYWYADYESGRTSYCFALGSLT